MQPEKYRRKKRHLSFWERERRAGERWRKRLDDDLARLEREAPWWERAIWWILRV
jgi:hypothetical protein